MVSRARELELYGTYGREAEYLVPLTAFGMTLAMQYVMNGSFEHASH